MAAPKPQGILEAALYVDDLDVAEAFYGGVLGLKRISRHGNRHVFYRVGGTILLLFNATETRLPTDNPRLPVPPHGTTGDGHVCFAMAGDDLDRLTDALAQAGVPVEADFRWPNGARSVYFRDPAGNSIEYAEPHLWEG